jgi:geranylgeranyl diphosphate synthase type I
MMYDHAVGAQNDTRGLALGASIELIQNYLLIVDDVMDRSTMRRSLPTAHIAYERDFLYARGREAEMIGMLVGMIAHHASNMLLLGSGSDADHVRAAMAVLERTTLITGIGQIDDLDQQLGREVGTEAMLRKYAQKSSYYTFAAPIEAALTLANGANDSYRLDAEEYGIPAGIAFQLRDDYLGIYGETKKTGKPNLDDVHEGKYTLMVHLALEAADDTTKKRIRAIIGDHAAGEAELTTLRTLLQQTGATDDAMAKAAHYAEQAKRAARTASSWGKEEADILEAIISFAMEREN